MKRLVVFVLILALALPLVPAAAQEDTCGSAPPSTLVGEEHAQAVAGQIVPVFDAVNGTSIGQLAGFTDPIYLREGPVCGGDVWWWQATAGDYYSDWMPETVNGIPVMEPYRFVPEPPVAWGIPTTPPVSIDRDVPLPAVQPGGNPQIIGYAPWDWAATLEGSWYEAPDPMLLRLPEAYAGDLPVPPVDLDQVHFVQDANLNPQQLALLAQNGFVVVPGGIPYFSDVYRGSEWSHSNGRGDFITTDALLNALYLVYQNTLMFLEMDSFYADVTSFVGAGYQAAEAQLRQAAGTPLETPARNAALYYAVALMLLAEGESSYSVGGFGEPGFQEGDLLPSHILKYADPDLLAQAQETVDMANAAEGRLKVPMLENLEEDFSQYKPRSYYAGNPLLEAYFRGMMWLGRITFRTNSNLDTLTGLLALRALVNAPGAYDNWHNVSDTLAFLVGPMDDFSPVEYLPLAEQVFGAGMPLDALADSANLAAFLAETQKLPGPRVNTIPLPIGITAEEVDAYTRGFRLFGQRFTLDGLVMQQLIYPEVGTAVLSRALPLGLDVAAALGSDVAYGLADDAGATAYEGYTDHMVALRTEVGGMDGDAWLENLYGGWLWALQPLLVRDPALVPPMMQTEAWKRKDIHTTLGSWTELKHATLLYVKQPTGGLGGGGSIPPVISTSIVEPNPLVFARIAIVASTLERGITARGFIRQLPGTSITTLRNAMNSLAVLAAQLAEIARKEVAGEPVSHDELYWMQENFDSALWHIRYEAEFWVTDPPQTVALVADVASNPNAGAVLEEAIGPVDLIYVIANGPNGLHLTRGGVYSYYEFVLPIDQRLTDDDWRAMVDSGNIPPRPDWVSLFFSE
jgi:hypothetical protein